MYQNLKKGRLAATGPLLIDVCIDSYPEAPFFILPVVNFVLGFLSNHFNFQLISHPTDIIMPISNYYWRRRPDYSNSVNREVKHGSYGKRQTAKMKLYPSVFNCLYSRVKLFVFAVNSKIRYSIFVCFTYGLEEKNSKSEVISLQFAVCR